MIKRKPSLPTARTALLCLSVCVCLGEYSQISPAAMAQSILPPRPEAIGGGNPLEGLGRTDDPNPSRAADFPNLNTLPTPTPDAISDAAPVDPNLSNINNLAAPPANGAIGNTPGADEALKKAQQLAKDEGDGRSEDDGPGSMFGNDKSENNNASREANFFKVVPDSPIRTTLVDIREGRYEAALNHLQSMYARNPAAIELQYLMGVSSVMLHRNAEAEVHYQKVLNDKLAPLRLKQLAQKGLDKLARPR